MREQPPQVLLQHHNPPGSERAPVDYHQNQDKLQHPDVPASNDATTESMAAPDSTAHKVGSEAVFSTSAVPGTGVDHIAQVLVAKRERAEKALHKERCVKIRELTWGIIKMRRDYSNSLSQQQ